MFGWKGYGGASLPLDATPRHADLEAGSLAQMPLLPEGVPRPPVRMIKLTAEREITPYKWVHPDEER
jgi:hypothetical protein